MIVDVIIVMFCDQIKDARPLIEDMEIEKRLDMAQVTKDAIKAVEETGIVFIDEIDKVRRGDTIAAAAACCCCCCAYCHINGGSDLSKTCSF